MGSWAKTTGRSIMLGPYTVWNIDTHTYIWHIIIYIYIYIMYIPTWTFRRSIIFGSFGVWLKMTQFSESRLILLVCLVLLPSGHTITTIDILNNYDWTWLASWLRPKDIPGHSHIPSTNAYECTYCAKITRKTPAKVRKTPAKPANARKSKNLVNWEQNTGEKTGPCWWETQPWHTTPNFLGNAGTLDTTINLMKRLIVQNAWYFLGAGRPRYRRYRSWI